MPLFSIDHTMRETTADPGVQIATIPLISALFAALVFAPMLWLGDLWIACAFTLGIFCGYLGYSTGFRDLLFAASSRPARRPDPR